MTEFRDVKIESPNLHLASGMPGSGKTVLAFSIADRIHAETGKPIYVAVGESQAGLPMNAPKWIHPQRGFDYPLDSVIIVDDAHLVAHARRFMSNANVYLDGLHGTLRHDDNDYIYDTQTLRALDANNILRSNYRWYKKPYSMDAKMGRPELIDELTEASKIPDYPETSLKSAYLAAETFDYKFSGRVAGIPLPKYWSSEWSVMHRRSPGIVGRITRIF